MATPGLVLLEYHSRVITSGHQRATWGVLFQQKNWFGPEFPSQDHVLICSSSPIRLLIM